MPDHDPTTPTSPRRRRRPGRVRRGPPGLLARLARLRRWLPPAVALVPALVTAWILLGNLRREVWVSFTDPAGNRIAAHDDKARPVLWEDPQPDYFAEPAAGVQPAAAADQANRPGGRLEAAFSADGMLMVLVRWDRLRTNADLYQSRWDGRVWSRPEPLAAVNSPFNDRGPALSRDGRYLFFASDRKGGAGGADLYVARWDGRQWAGADPLGPAVNSPADESGPALSADGSQLYFTSNRGAAGPDPTADIYVARRAGAAAAPALEQAGPPAPPAEDRSAGVRAPVPQFEAAAPVDRLNSDADDLEAVLTRRGDHVFLASDRDRTGKSGFGVYLSRVVNGQVQPPEKVDLHLDQGDVTDPAVRMDGFDLLFSADLGAAQPAAGGAPAEPSGFRLYRSTTREVIGYTDLGRWEQFKVLLRNIAWWVLLAAAALVALIYLLESWHDITSLFHKCLAASLGLHLLALLLAMAWLIAVELETDATSNPAEIEVRIDALAQEQLAQESMPEEARITEVETALATRKADSGPEIPDFEPQEADNTEPVPTAVTREVVEFDLRAPETEPADAPVPEPGPESTVLSQLSATVLPDPEIPQLEERTEAPPAAAPESEQFEPQPVAAVAARAETAAVEDSAVAATAEVDPAEQLEDAAREPVAEVNPTPVAQPAAVPAPVQPVLESETLDALPEATFADAEPPQLEEADPNAAQAAPPADPATERFTPAEVAAELDSAKVASQPVADQSVEAPVDAPAVAAETAAPAAADSAVRPAEVAEAAAPEAEPRAPLDANLTDASLPESTFAGPAAVHLEEADPNQAQPATPVDTASEQFAPGEVSSELAAAKATSEPLADQSVEAPPEAPAITGAKVAAASGDFAVRPAEVAAGAAQEAPPQWPIAPGLPATLPDSVLTETGAPHFEEADPNQPQPVAPADPAADVFRPAAPAAALASTRAGNRPVADTAVDQAAEIAQIGAAAAASDAQPPGTGTPARHPGEAREPMPHVPLAPAELAAATVGLLPAALESPGRNVDGDELAKLIRKQRGKPDLEGVRQLGGSGDTERSIRSAIKWLIENQEPDGRWDTRKHGAKADYDTGGAGLALLCFYGWGARHDQPGDYQAKVLSALDWLLAQQAADGNLGGQGYMYCHAIATIALCEAYGITKDPKLRRPAERAIAYTLAAQSPTKGGWRYEPGDDSDTSITGWQFMALHSARMAGLEVPEAAFEKARGWLKRASGGRHGGLYGYQGPATGSPAMVATGMFCRQLDLVPPTDPMMVESANHLKMHPLDASGTDLYHVYYATLALYQHQGPIWNKWNESLKSILPLIQRKTGPHAGSWNPSSGITAAGGRVASTTLATLSLEVYYRILPMYGFRNEDDAPPAMTLPPAPPTR